MSSVGAWVPVVLCPSAPSSALCRGAKRPGLFPCCSRACVSVSSLELDLRREGKRCKLLVLV